MTRFRHAGLIMASMDYNYWSRIDERACVKQLVERALRVSLAFWCRQEMALEAHSTVSRSRWRCVKLAVAGRRHTSIIGLGLN